MSLNIMCTSHGDLAHVAVHEAAHAVFAIDLGIEFKELTISPPSKWLPAVLTGGAVEAGGVVMTSEWPRDWVGPNPEAALEFLLAGALGERQILGHELPRGFEGDVDQFKRGMGVSAFTPEEITRWMPPAVQRVRDRMPDLEPKIRHLSDEIRRRLRDEPGELTISYLEVIEIVAQAAGVGGAA